METVSVRRVTVIITLIGSFAGGGAGHGRHEKDNINCRHFCNFVLDMHCSMDEPRRHHTLLADVIVLSSVS